MQIINAKMRNVDQSAVLDSQDFHINPENTGHIMQILRDMYSDPVLAVLREYTANAVDAHKQIGSTKPFDVVLPKDIDPVLRIRDYGPGLSMEDTKELLYGFGSSGEHKRTSNDQIGGFGIGCKCAFSVADSFTYTVWHGGMKRIWSCFLDDRDCGKAVMQFECEDKKSPSGVEVSIPLQPDQIARVHDLAATAFQFYSLKPNVLNALVKLQLDPPEPVKTAKLKFIDADKKESVVTIDFHSSSGQDVPSGVVMGGILYPFSWSTCSMDNLYHSDDAPKQMRDMYRTHKRLSGRMTVHAPIGWVALAPSRESIQYSKHTKNMFASLYKALTMDTLNKIFDIDAGKATLNEKLEKVSVFQDVADHVHIMKTALQTEKTGFWKMSSSERYLFPVTEGQFYGAASIGCVQDYAYPGYSYGLKVGTDDSTTDGLGVKQLLSASRDMGPSGPQVIIGFVNPAISGTGSGHTQIAKDIFLKLNTSDSTGNWDTFRKELSEHNTRYSRNFGGNTIVGHVARVVLFKAKTDEERKALTKAMNLSNRNGVYVAEWVYTKSLPKARCDELQECTHKSRTRSRGDGPQDYAQHKEKCFKLTDSRTYGVRSQNWDSLKVDWKDRGNEPTPVLPIHKFQIMRSGLPGNTFEALSASTTEDSGLLARIKNQSALWQELCGMEDIPALRSGDVAKLLKRKNCPAMVFGEWWDEHIVKPIMDHNPMFAWWITLDRDGHPGIHGSSPVWAVGMLSDISTQVLGATAKSGLPAEVRNHMKDLAALQDCKDWIVENILNGRDELYCTFCDMFAYLVKLRSRRDAFVGSMDQLDKAHVEFEHALLDLCPAAWAFLLPNDFARGNRYYDVTASIKQLKRLHLKTHGKELDEKAVKPCRRHLGSNEEYMPTVLVDYLSDTAFAELFAALAVKGTEIPSAFVGLAINKQTNKRS